MSNKTIRNKHNIYNTKGGLVKELKDSDGNNKEYAVIAKCGHCGIGYFIPIMFLQHCRDAKTASEATKSNGFVKRDDKECILGVVELHGLEYTFVEYINRVDPYLNGYFTKDNDEILTRRVADNPNIDYYKNKIYLKAPTDGLKTAEEYYHSQVLESAFAPVFDGQKYIYPRNINTKQLLHDFIREKTLRHGVAKGDISFLSLYYQMYGSENDLGIVLKDNKFYCKIKNTKKVYDIPQVYMDHIKESGILEKTSEPKKEDFSFETAVDYDKSKRTSQIDKFRARYGKPKIGKTSSEDDKGLQM